MKIKFEKQYLKELYETGKVSKPKKYFFQAGVIRQYTKTVDRLAAADCIEDLFPIVSLQYEVLIGDLKGIESVRVNRQYRLLFKSEISNESGLTLTICSIIELSKHYQ